MAHPAPLPRRVSLGADVYESLKALILEHTLQPGDRVNIDALARSLEVSPTPVREALARLESEGLVRKRPLVGFTVSPLLSRAEFENMFEVRMLLECAAARYAAERASADQRAAISTIAARELPANGDDSWHAAFTAMDAELHGLIAEASGNDLLREGIDRLHAHLHLHRQYFPYALAKPTRAEHRRIADAIRRGRSEDAAAAMGEHLTRARLRHLANFS
jgi:DNA-binding GntR family transcriptional regulator